MGRVGDAPGLHVAVVDDGVGFRFTADDRGFGASGDAGKHHQRRIGVVAREDDRNVVGDGGDRRTFGISCQRADGHDVRTGARNGDLVACCAQLEVLDRGALQRTEQAVEVGRLVLGVEGPLNAADRVALAVEYARERVDQRIVRGRSRGFARSDRGPLGEPREVDVVEQHHFARGVLPAARAAAGVDRFGESHQVGARCDARFGRSVGNDGRLAHAERHGHAVGTVREGDRPFAVGAAVVLIVVGHERMGRGDHLRARRRGGFEPRLALLGDRHVVFDVGRDFDVELREFAFEGDLRSGSELRVPRRGCDLGRSVGEEEGLEHGVASGRNQDDRVALFGSLVQFHRDRAGVLVDLDRHVPGREIVHIRLFGFAARHGVFDVGRSRTVGDGRHGGSVERDVQGLENRNFERTAVGEREADHAALFVGLDLLEQRVAHVIGQYGLSVLAREPLAVDRPETLGVDAHRRRHAAYGHHLSRGVQQPFVGLAVVRGRAPVEFSVGELPGPDDRRGHHVLLRGEGDGFRLAAVIAVADDVIAFVVLFEVGDEAAVDERRERVHLVVEFRDALFGRRKLLLDGVDVFPQLPVVVLVASPEEGETGGKQYDVQ